MRRRDAVASRRSSHAARVAEEQERAQAEADERLQERVKAIVAEALKSAQVPPKPADEPKPPA